MRTTPDTDDAPAEEVLREVKRCARHWTPDSRLLGNVRAKDIIRAIAWYELELDRLRRTSGEGH